MNAEARVRVLVADDSEDNRFLLEAYCESTSYDLTFAEDGEKAVAAYQSAPFAIVIMDIQMPVMDGLAATRAIRQVEARQGAKRTPILALTANVLPEDAAEARAAGCDVHLPKPISKHDFLSALDRWSALGEPRETLVRIEIQPGLEELAASFLAARRRELPVFVELCGCCAFEEVARLAHNLKGNGASYGFPDLTGLGAALERAAVARDADGLATQIAALESYVEAAGERLAVLPVPSAVTQKSH